MPNVEFHAIRLKPGTGIKNQLQDFVHNNKLAATWISARVDRLTKYNIRLANQPKGCRARDISGLLGSGNSVH